MNLCPKHKVPLLPEGAHLLYCPDERCCHTVPRKSLPPQGRQKVQADSSLSSFPKGVSKKRTKR